MTYFVNRLIYELKMWKFLIRGIRDTIEKGGERAITSVVENCQGNLSLVGNNKNQEQDNKSENSEKDAGNDNCHGKKSQLKLQTFLEAVGWSTVIWLGSFASHPQCWRKHNHSVACDISPKKDCRYKGLVRLIAGTASAQPLNSRMGPPSLVTDEEDGDLSKDKPKATSEPSSDSEEPDDALETARLQLQATSGYIDNRLGVMFVDSGKHAIAFKYFEHAWGMGDVSACYNLALCYELGLGVAANQVLAMRYYKKAYYLGHAPATYNLGVYYAQGRGGLTADPLMARQLFRDAANQGVAEAKAALALGEEDGTAASVSVSPAQSSSVSSVVLATAQDAEEGEDPEWDVTASLPS